jgi:DNA-binding NarL/FixJ family response regulator
MPGIRRQRSLAGPERRGREQALGVQQAARDHAGVDDVAAGGNRHACCRHPGRVEGPFVDKGYGIGPGGDHGYGLAGEQPHIVRKGAVFSEKGVQQLRVLIADDHVLVRSGLRRVVESFPGAVVVAEADDGDQVPALVAEHQPDVVITDLSMRRQSGYDVLRTLARDHPRVRVIVVSMHADAGHVRHALDAGACGYVVKDAAPVELELALRAAAAGQTFLSPSVSAAQLERDEGPRLSPRQAEILRMIGQGLATKQIAAKLELSVKTVETHRARLMRTLNLRRSSELVRYAVLNSAQTRD